MLKGNPDDTLSTVVYSGMGTETSEDIGLFLPNHQTERKYMYAKGDPP